MTTIKDVARIAGVSIASVSRVINNGPKVSKATIEKVNKVMQDIGYTPDANARALVTRKSMTIGVVIPELTDPFFASLASGVDKVARENTMQLLLSTAGQSAESERAAINLLLERRCQTIVMHSKKLSDEELIALSEKLPGLVLINRHIEEISHKCIWLDNQEGGKIAARHIMALKHQSIACISSKYQIDDPALRFNGFSAELAVAGNPINPALIKYAEPNQQGGETAAQSLLASGEYFSAIFVYNDAMAIGAISTLEDNGYKVPGDVSVIGFDDVLIARYSRPKLTTLRYPIETMAQHAAQLAINSLAEYPQTFDNSINHQYLPCLVKRESTSIKNSRA
jgi:LacI family transcriptional regulator